MRIKGLTIILRYFIESKMNLKGFKGIFRHFKGLYGILGDFKRFKENLRIFRNFKEF